MSDEAVVPAAEPEVEPAHDEAATIAAAPDNPPQESATPAAEVDTSPPEAPAAPPSVVADASHTDVPPKDDDAADLRPPPGRSRRGVEDKKGDEEPRTDGAAAAAATTTDTDESAGAASRQMGTRKSVTKSKMLASRKSIYYFGVTKKRELEWENSYRLGPTMNFPMGKAKGILQNVLEKKLQEVEEYESSTCLWMAKNISQEIRENLKKLWAST